VSELITRALAESDAPAITGLMNAIEVVAGAEPVWTDGEIRGLMAGWMSDGPDDSRLMFTIDGTLVAAGMVAPPDHGTGADTFGGVHPDWRGRGIGRGLLQWQFDRLAQIRDVRAPGIDWQIDAGAGVADVSATRLYERLGMHAVRYFSDMRASTAGVPTATFPAGLRALPYEDAMFPALYEGHMEAFQDHWGYQRSAAEKWKARTVDSETFRADLSRVVFDGDEMAGYLLGHDGADDSLYVSHVGTRRPWRKRGLASALLADVLAAAAKAGKPTATLAVDADSPTGAVGVYERVGFTVTSRFVDYRKPLPA
jgi:ribosomal protein S18 acetylase RimI-like enzyme